MRFRWSSRDIRCVGVALLDEKGALVASHRTKDDAMRAAKILTDMSVLSRGRHLSSDDLHRLAMEICRRQHGHENYHDRRLALSDVRELLSPGRQGGGVMIAEKVRRWLAEWLCLGLPPPPSPQGKAVTMRTIRH